MNAPGRAAADELAFESFGVRVRVAADRPELLERFATLLPPGARPCPPSEASASFAVVTEPGGTYMFTRDDSPVTKGAELDFVTLLMESQLRVYVGLNAPGRIFVHAGVVAHAGRAIVVPGLSFAGKTRLVLALIRAGATYYSDEYAVIDESGLVHAFPKPLSVRVDGEEAQVDRSVAEYGAAVGEQPLQIGLTAFTTYRRDAVWAPQQLALGPGVLAMLGHTLSARQRPDEALPALRRALDGALLLQGERGEAEATATALLGALPG